MTEREAMQRLQSLAKRMSQQNVTTENPDYSQPYVREEINWEPSLVGVLSDKK